MCPITHPQLPTLQALPPQAQVRFSAPPQVGGPSGTGSQPRPQHRRLCLGTVISHHLHHSLHRSRRTRCSTNKVFLLLGHNILLRNLLHRQLRLLLHHRQSILWMAYLYRRFRQGSWHKFTEVSTSILILCTRPYCRGVTRDLITSCLSSTTPTKILIGRGWIQPDLLLPFVKGSRPPDE